MATSKVVQPPPPRKVPRIVKRVASSEAKLLHPCPRCERPIFWCLWDSPPNDDTLRLVGVHVLSRRSGRVAIQLSIGVDVLVAVDVRKSSRTFYALHPCRIAPPMELVGVLADAYSHGKLS